MRRPPNRRELQRALALNAATKPLNVLVPTGVSTAGLLLDAPWPLPIALVCRLALAVTTFFDDAEARAVGERMRACRRAPVPRVPPPTAPAIAGRWEAALAARAAIRHAVAPSALRHEVDALVDALRPTVVRAQRVHDADSRAPRATKRAAHDRLQARLEHLLHEIDEVVATLETVHAEILVNDGLEQDALVADLRTRLQLLATGEPAA